MEEKEYLTPEQIADLLQLDTETVYRKLRNGDLPGRKIGGSWRSRKVDIENLFKARK
jgi:excisionase family DNA binding protein